MTVKTKKIMLATAAVAMLCVAMATAVFLSGGLHHISGVFNSEVDTTTESQTQATTIPTVARVKTERPEKIRGVWFTAGIDYLTDITLTDEQTESEIASKIQDIKSMGFNTVFFDWELSTASRLLDKNDDGLSLLGLCLEHARKNNLFIVVTLPINECFSDGDDNKPDRSKVEGFVKTYNADVILVSGIEALQSKLTGKTTTEIQETVSEYLSTFYLAASSSDELLLVGSLALEDDPLTPTVIQNLVSTNDSNIFLLESSVSNTAVDAKTKKTREDSKNTLNKFVGKYISGQKIDALFSGKKANGITDIIHCISAGENTDNSFGTAFRCYSLIKNDTTGLAKAFLEHLESLNKNGFGKVFSVFNQKSNEIKTNESKINFTGNCVANLPLTCNGKNIETSKIGDFSVDYDLTPGVNNFEFKQGDASYSYKVVYEVDILKKVSPKGNITAPGGTVIEITAVALKNAEVSVTINKKTLKMKQGTGLDLNNENEDKSPDTSSDYVTYYGQYVLPKGAAAQQNLGTASVQAKYNGLSKKLTGAKVTVTANPPVTVVATTEPITEPITEPQSVETTSSSTTPTEPTSPTTPTTIPIPTQLLTPYNYAGVPGVSRMCEIMVGHCEAMPFSPFNNASYPLTTPLLAGMFDYIDGESSYEKYLYYHLRSGKRVYREEVKVIGSGYNMPLNKIQTLNSSTKNDTVINLALTWKVPVNVVVKGQNYAKINSNNFEVWSFTGNCIEFTFSYTAQALGAVDVSGSNIISSAEWSTDPAKQTSALRLYFKRTGVFYGYDISYNEDGSFKILIKNKPSNALSGYKIMLDPGHGGKDSGAICISTTPANMKYEKHINLALALKIKQRLESNGATVLMTRSNDSAVEVNDRRIMIYNTKPDLNISIHCDGSTNSSVFGTSSFYYYPQSFPFANALREEILACYSNSIRPTNDRHTKYSRFMITRLEICPSILIEYGFVTNLEECRLLQNDANQNKLADATVQGIIKFIAQN